ncbi:MAG: hypothetical protein LH606_17605 [Cytophagaceae bacterium]|nr:hypothetical protein [Cytophagaceae bacterium]
MRLFHYLFLSLVGELATNRPVQAQRVETTLPVFNQQRQRITESGMFTVTAWGAGNLIANGLSLKNASGSNKAFYQMNMAWGAVDLLLGGVGLLGNRRAKTDLSVYESLEEQQKIEKIFLVNAGLDVAYVTGGFYLRERAKAQEKNSERNEGYGRSLVLQGGFLLLFDGAMYAVHRAHFKRNKGFWQRLEVAGSGVGVKVNF